MEFLKDLECVIRSEIENNLFIFNESLFIQFPNNTTGVVYNTKDKFESNFIKTQNQSVDNKRKLINNFNEFVLYLRDLIETDFNDYKFEESCFLVCGNKFNLKEL